MNRKNQQSIDGFVPRRRIGQSQQQTRLGGLQQSSSGALDRSRNSGQSSMHTQPTPQARVRRAELDATLASIDDTPEVKSAPKAKRRISRKSLKRIFIALIVAGLLIAGFLGIKGLLAGASIFQGNLLGLVQNKPLKEDDNGRSNIVIFGTSEDDEGGDHPGAYLTDSIMVVSLNQTKKNAYMFSIPRDLWVEYDTACGAGYEGKINEVFTCYSNSGEDEPAGSNALRKKIGEVTGLDAQYYAHVNYSVVRDAVDAVGGVEVTIESDDPRGILDRNFDWKCNYQCNYVKYENGKTGVMDGEHALALARARGSSAPTYGLEQGNFSREKNQQKILTALKSKAVSAGTVTNIGKVSGLLDAFGENLRTNFETNEIRTLMNLSSDISTKSIKSLSLVDETDPVVTTGMLGAQSIVRPVAGLYDYSGIASYLNKSLNSSAATREAAKIGVYNGSDKAGVAQTVADKLSAKGLNVVTVDNAPDGQYKRYELYVLNSDKPATKKKLEKLYGVKARTTSPPVDTIGVDIVLIIGQAS